MYRTIFAALSTDDFIADTIGNQDWTSVNDATFLKHKLKSYSVLVMGRKTFEANISRFTSPKKIRVVLTSKPDYYAKKYPSIAAQFTNKSLIEALAPFTRKNIAILGGTKIYTDAITSGICTDAYITLEPVTLGNGVPFTNPPGLLRRYYLVKLKNDLPQQVKYFVKN